MRRTTELIMAHLPNELALLVEYMLGAPNKFQNPFSQYFEIAFGGHEELIQASICQKNAYKMAKGAASTSNITLLKKTLLYDVKELHYVAAAASSHNADNEVFDLLLKNTNVSPIFALRHATFNNNMRIIKHIISLGMDPIHYNVIVATAMRVGNISLVHWVLNQGEYIDWSYTLYFAANGAQKAMCLICLYNGADPNRGLYGACLDVDASHMKLIYYFVQIGATDFNGGLKRACEEGFQNAIDYMIQLGANQCDYCGESVEKHANKYEYI